MNIQTTSYNTRSMQGQKVKDNAIFDLLVDTYGLKAVLESEFDTDNSIYSNGFIHAIRMDRIPTLELFPINKHHSTLEEYHHVIINDECYKIYFISE